MNDGAPYEVRLSLSDDSTFTFTFILTEGDDPFPWDGSSFEYVVRDECGAGGFLLTSANGGIVINPAVDSLTLTRADPHGLHPGRYHHGLRLTDAAGRRVIFVGTLDVYRDPFSP